MFQAKLLKYGGHFQGYIIQLLPRLQAPLRRSSFHGLGPYGDRLKGMEGRARVHSYAPVRVEKDRFRHVFY